MKNILIIHGGGRPKGNTVQLVESFVRRCLGCNACRYGKPCVQKDAFYDIVPEIKEADCIVSHLLCISGHLSRLCHIINLPS